MCVYTGVALCMCVQVSEPFSFEVAVPFPFSETETLMLPFFEILLTKVQYTLLCAHLPNSVFVFPLLSLLWRCV